MPCIDAMVDKVVSLTPDQTVEEAMDGPRNTADKNGPRFLMKITFFLECLGSSRF